ncbi:MAG TPA: hypothetical protein VM925_01990 [Labilithrix sp.]|jgi:hypothetical protein|nr:hypothetical protein [Labilithrix sp.]
MRRSSFAAMFACAAIASFVLTTVGCDQLNKPMRTPPGTSSSSGAPMAMEDAGDGAEGGAPAPMITAQPGDIHL